MLKLVKDGIQKLISLSGYRLTRLESQQGFKRATILKSHDIGTVLDVGSNMGQYALELREYGFSGKIISFEPTTKAFKHLADRAAPDASWSVHNMAVGDTNGEVTINVAANHAESSSLLPMLDAHKRAAPEALYTSTETVSLCTLDSILEGKLSPGDKVMLKCDTQGYEHLVLKGAAKILPFVSLIECELSMVPLYDGQLLFHAMLDLLADLGFQPVQFMPGFTDPHTGHSLQIDAIFAKSQAF